MMPLATPGFEPGSPPVVVGVRLESTAWPMLDSVLVVPVVDVPDVDVPVVDVPDVDVPDVDVPDCLDAAVTDAATAGAAELAKLTTFLVAFSAVLTTLLATSLIFDPVV